MLHDGLEVGLLRPGVSPIDLGLEIDDGWGVNPSGAGGFGLPRFLMI